MSTKEKKPKSKPKRKASKEKEKKKKPTTEWLVPRDNKLIMGKEMLSSKEIARLTGKSLKHIHRDILTMIEKLEDGPNVHHLHSKYSISRDSRGYIKEIFLNEELCYTLAAGYDVFLRNNIIQEWMEIRRKKKSVGIWQVERNEGKVTRRTLTDAIQDSGENERMHGHAYVNYTKLVYRSLGLPTKVPDDFRDKLPTEALEAIERVEDFIVHLLDSGFIYDAIKPLVLARGKSLENKVLLKIEERVV